MKNRLTFWLLSAFCLLLLPPVSGQQQMRCGNEETQLTPALRQLMRNLKTDPAAVRARIKAAAMLELRVGIDVDYVAYQKFAGDSNAVIRYVHNTLKEAAGVLAEEVKVRLTISHIEVWKQPEAYGQHDYPSSLMYYALAWWDRERKSVYPYDILLCFSGRRDPSGFAGYGMLGMDRIGTSAVLCNVGPEYVPRTTALHEIGHVLGSPHTHNCSWPDGPIDRCMAVEGTCYTGEPEGQLGTIMSYCQAVFSFHPYCRALIRKVVENSGLRVLDAPPGRPTPLPSAGGPEGPAPNLRWSPADRAERYRVQLATDNTFAAVAVDTVVPFQRYYPGGLPTGKNWFWRVKALNGIGEGEWAVGEPFTPASGGTLRVPSLRLPETNRIFSGEKITWFSVEGATAYRVQVSTDQNFTPGSSAVFHDETVAAAELTLDRARLALCNGDCPYLWRVQAIRGAEATAWSEIRSFRLPPAVGGFEPNAEQMELKRYGTSLPIGVGAGNWAETVLQLEVSQTPDFTSPALRRERLINQIGTPGYEWRSVMMADSLAPSTTYHYRIRARAEGTAGPWAGGTFTTGAPRPVWRYFNAANSPVPATGYSGIQVAPDGTVWVATDWGLMRSTNDGKDWTRFHSGNTDQVLNQAVGAIALDRDSRLWALNPTALVRFDGRTWTRFPYPEGARVNGENVLVIDKADQTAYAVFGQKIYRFRDGNWAIFPLPPSVSMTIQSGVVDRNRHVWLASYSTASGIIRFDGTSFDIHTPANSSLPAYRADFCEIAADSTGNEIWISGAFGLARWTGGHNWELTMAQELNPQDEVIVGLTFDRKNRLIALGRKGMYVRENNLWTSLGESFLGYANPYTVMTTDPENRVWIGTIGIGMAVYDSRTIRPGTLPAAVCSGDSIKVPFRPDFVPRPGIRYTAQLTDAAGRVFATVSARFSGDTAIVPLSDRLTPGGQYKIRIVSENPAVVGDESAAFALTARPVVSLPVSGPAALCPGQTVAFQANGTPGQYQWYRNDAPIAGATTLTYTATQAGKYTLKVTQNGCSTVSPPVSVEEREGATAAASPQGPTEVYKPETVRLTANAGPGLKYQWRKDGADLPGATGGTYEAAESGLYAVQVSNAGGCTAVSAAVRVAVLAPLSVGPVGSAFVLTVSPNPAERFCTVSLAAPVRERTELTLTDAGGRLVLKQTLTPGQSRAELPLGGLAPGRYQVQVRNRQGGQTGRLLILR
ncbi:M12 family metallo-peptidase [Larkinella soli]|uniref:M12 family metallo-peptidase n=1 Tax=Larkinella soli TaxID=1770527 RepID=UPI000FFCA83E|nr:M12 family metallo-peptidase [Larkinella soli]